MRKSVPNNESAAPPAAGPAQTVGRAIQLLRLVASSRSREVILVDLASMAGLQKSTAHRLLQRLVAERLLTHEAGRRGYRLGPLLYELGLAAFPESNLREVAQSSLEELAQKTGDMAFLLMRSGYEAVCLQRVAGNFAIQTMTAGIGDRHPLGVGAGSLAILAAMDDPTIERVIEAAAPQLGRYGLDANTLRARVIEARTRGYTVDEGGAATDVTAVGRAIRDRHGAPVGAVFVASIRSRMTTARIVETSKRIGSTVKAIESALTGLEHDGRGQR
ncbi:MAG: hypothetical protein JWP43_2780 [Ramlibacter sp.]|jgi:DNA-binding IclR family transcriptional regulator|nr:hypothetical protein [Ramlibacter sp.]